jgi:hypothetical protein
MFSFSGSQTTLVFLESWIVSMAPIRSSVHRSSMNATFSSLVRFL